MYPIRRQKDFRFTLALLALSCSSGAAHSQTSANLTLVSAYTARGVTFDTRPTPQLRVEHDADGGWYAGGFVSPARYYGRSQVQAIAYGGHAQRLTSTLTFDAGISRSVFSRDRVYDYSEVYAGLMAGQSSARLFYSPAYYGEGRTLYLDLNTAYPLAEKLSLALHGGVLRPLGTYSEYGASPRTGADVRIGLATDVGDVRLQVGWQASWRRYLQRLPPARALTASASWYF